MGGHKMKWSLINVWREDDGYVDGTWFQNVTSTLQEAIEVAKATEKANSNKISVAVVEDLGCPTPNYNPQKHLKRIG